jgi:multicomponent Na+:H+ antiporter subunit A
MNLLVVLGVLAALAATAPALARRWHRDAGYPLAAGYLLVGALLAGQLPRVLAGGAVEVSWRWLPSAGVSAALRLDGLAVIFGLLVLGVGALIMAYCPRYLDDDHDHAALYLLLTLFTAAMLGLVFAADLIVLVVFWELTSLLSFALIAQAGPGARRPASRALLVTAAGGLALLAAAVGLSVAYGTTELEPMLNDPERLRGTPFGWAVGALIIVAAFTKSAQLPFHFWLPNAMAAITPVSAYLHAATMVKAGIYLLMRFTPAFAGQPAWTGTLLGVGLATALLGAFLAMRQDDLKALLAYSTVSQLGLLVAVIGVGTPIALEAALLHTIAHALFKATLFMLVGIIDREAGSRDLQQLSGLARKMPLTAALTGLAAMSMAGLPPLLGFVSKEAIFDALDEPGLGRLAPVAAGLGVAASILTFAYGTRIMYAFIGPLRQPELYRPARSFLAPAAAAALLGLLLGPGVPILSAMIERATVDARPGGRPVNLGLWHGVNTAFWLSLTTIALGTLLFLARRRVNPWLRRVPTPPPAIRGFDRAYAGLLHLGAVAGHPDRRSGTGSYLVRPILALVLLAAAALPVLGPPAFVGPAGDARGQTVGAGEWPLVGLLALAVAGLVAVRSALATVALASLVGLVMSVWFLLRGAPDVALTLMLVEVLTAVVAMLVLRGLPRRLPGGSKHTAGVAAVAVAAGAALGYATAVLTGRGGISEPGRSLLRGAAERAGGDNVVNTILVDFRALDTLGEAAVLAAVALGVVALRPPPRRSLAGRPARSTPTADVTDPVLHVTYRILAPVMLVVSAYLLLRGHDEPGGGFIAALVAGTAVGLGLLTLSGAGAGAGAGASTRPAGLPPARPLLAAGFLTALPVAMAPLLWGRPLLSPVRIPLPVPAGSVSGGLIFDIGVYLLVLGFVVAVVGRLWGSPEGAAGPPGTAHPADAPAGGAR